MKVWQRHVIRHSAGSLVCLGRYYLFNGDHFLNSSQLWKELLFGLLGGVLCIIAVVFVDLAIDRRKVADLLLPKVLGLLNERDSGWIPFVKETNLEHYLILLLASLDSLDDLTHRRASGEPQIGLSLVANASECVKLLVEISALIKGGGTFVPQIECLVLVC